MSTNKLIKLPSFSYTSLDFDTIVSDVKNLISEHPEYNENWDDFLESNAGKMFVEVMSYIMEKNTSKTDWSVNELFFSTATQRQSLIDLLSLINHKPYLPKASTVLITAKLTKWVEGWNLTNEKLTGLDINGAPVNFELLMNANDGKPDYGYTHFLDTGTKENPNLEIENIPFIQGSTVQDSDIYLRGIDNEKVLLTSYPVIENTIRVNSLTRIGNPEFPEVESFISPEAQQNTVAENDKLPPYIVKIDAQNRATIIFSISSLATVPMKNESIIITYRTGGGFKTNIVAKSINTSKTHIIGNERVTLIYGNPSAAFGGADEERLDDAKLTAPISLRSANKTVTKEDYVVHLEKIPIVMKANVIGKENEPSDILKEYGYKLPPLDTWIYVTPERSWETMNPYIYNKELQISRPYNISDIIDFEDITITTTDQTVYLKKYKKYMGFKMYVTLHESSIECTDYLSAISFIKDSDFVINEISSEFTRISTGDGGSIPSGSRTLRIRYIYNEDINSFYNNTVKTFTASGSDNIINLEANSNSLYPQHNIVISNKEGNAIYSLDYDYTIDWSSGIIYRVNTSNIDLNETVIVYYAKNWDPDIPSEEKNILNEISNKRMICVDNYIKDSVYSPFDIVAKVYCYKNLKKSVQDNLETYLRTYYNLSSSYYNSPIIKSDIIGKVMNFSGVRFIEIDYLGKNYDSYTKYILDEISAEELETLEANNVTQRIPSKYNEILILANDEWNGAQILENKKHGLIFEYKDEIS